MKHEPTYSGLRAGQRTYWGVLLLCLLSLRLDAAKWTYIRMADDLPVGSVAGIQLSPRDLVWIRHQDANLVSEMDGYELFNYPIPSDAANKVHQSRSGQLWAAKPDGLYVFYRSRWTPYQVDPIGMAYQHTVQRLQSPVALLPLQINHCLILAMDQLFEFSTDHTGNRLEKWMDFRSLGLEQSRGMVEGSQGDIVVVGKSGFLHFRGPAKELALQIPTKVPLPESLEHLSLSNPLEGPDGQWTFIGEASGEPKYLLSYHQDTWQGFQAPLETKLRHFWIDAVGNGWATSYNGLFAINLDQEQLIASTEVEAGLFFDVITDGQGQAWLATNEGVVCQSANYWEKDPLLSEDETVYDMAQGADGDSWLASESALICLSNHQTDRFPWPGDQDLMMQPGRCLYPLKEGLIGIQTDQGAFVFDKKNKLFAPIIHPSQPEKEVRILGHQTSLGLITSIIPSAKDQPATLEFFDGLRWQSNGHPWPQILPERELLWATLLDQEMWIGWNQGVAYASGKDWMVYQPEDGIGEETPQKLTEIRNGQLWLAAGSHLYELDRNQWERFYDAGDKIHGILPSRDGSVWLTTSSGIHRFSNETWMRHDTREGLPSNTVYQLLEQDHGRLIAATTRGIACYTPEVDTWPPTTQIQTDSPSNSGEIGKGSEIFFTGVDRWEQTANTRLLYSYRQDNNPWSAFSPLNRIVLGDLAAGIHRIEVRSMDRNGNVEKPRPGLSFIYTIPWKEDPRLMEMLMAAMLIMIALAGLAINRHWRLKRSYAEVERLVQSRTMELEQANRELLQDQKMKALGTLASGIAHDFNSILSIIKGSAQIIEAKSQNQELVQKRLKRIHSVVDQGAGIVQSMLGYVRRGRQDIKRVDLKEVTLDAVRLAQESRPGLKVNVQPPSSPLWLTIDTDLLKQIMINLIHNAMDSMQEGDPVQVRLRRTDHSTGHNLLKGTTAKIYACIDVEDRGVGIDERNLPRIMEPFFTTKAFSARHGTGLGLSMVYEMAKGIQASLTVQSSPGNGSCFSIYLAMDEASIALNQPLS